MKKVTCYCCSLAALFLLVVLPVEAHKTQAGPAAVITQVWAYSDIVTDSLVLNYKQNNLRFYFSTRGDSTLMPVTYQYRLVGVHDKWSSPDIHPWAFLTDISPGRYTFEVRCRCASGPWGAIATHAFIIESPWWRTWWAYLIYAVMVTSLLIYILYLVRARIRLYNQLNLEHQINNFRKKYIIQISRELRTPLTIIRSTIEKQKGSQGGHLTRTDLQHLRNSSRMLMEMVEKMVEFRETDSDSLAGAGANILELPDVPINQQTVLVVEKNKQLADVIMRDMLRLFKIVILNDGRELIQKMSELEPSAVVIDTDLDGVNAYELIHRVKNISQWKYTPVIILSEFDTNRSLIKAIRSDADDYLQKPFNCEVLMFMIIKKIKTMQSLMTEKSMDAENERMMPGRAKQKNTILEKRSDMIFLERLELQVADHYSNPDFDVRMLSELLKISRGQLYKKIQTLKSQSPVEYIRDYRLKCAAKLIRETDYTIQQVMYRVGMPDAKNFYNRFREKYDMSPSIYRNRL